MKKLAFAISLFACCATTLAQESISYHDWLGRPCFKDKASMIYVLTKTDSSWCKKLYFLPDLQLGSIYNYKDSACQILDGSFWEFHPNGQLKRMGRYKNRESIGVWLVYNQTGALIGQCQYEGGYNYASSLSWHENGIMSDSSQYNPDDSTLVTVGWHADGAPSYAGKWKNGKAVGKWKFYHPTGHLSAEVWYNDGKRYKRKLYDEDGVAETDTTGKDRNAFYKKGLARWVAYIERHINFPAQYQTVNRNSFTINVTFTVDEKGEIKEVFTISPTHPDFNKALLAAMKKAPKWEPAILNNRKTSCYMGGKFTFAH